MKKTRTATNRGKRNSRLGETRTTLLLCVTEQQLFDFDVRVNLLLPKFGVLQELHAWFSAQRWESSCSVFLSVGDFRGEHVRNSVTGCLECTGPSFGSRPISLATSR